MLIRFLVEHEDIAVNEVVLELPEGVTADSEGALFQYLDDPCDWGVPEDHAEVVVYCRRCRQWLKEAKSWPRLMCLGRRFNERERVAIAIQGVIDATRYFGGTPCPVQRTYESHPLVAPDIFDDRSTPNVDYVMDNERELLVAIQEIQTWAAPPADAMPDVSEPKNRRRKRKAGRKPKHSHKEVWEQWKKHQSECDHNQAKFVRRFYKNMTSAWFTGIKKEALDKGW